MDFNQMFDSEQIETVLNAYYIMREPMLVGSILSISESLTNMIQQDLNKLQEPSILQNKILLNIGNPSKAWMFLELGIWPLKYVIITQCLKSLKYILEN